MQTNEDFRLQFDSSNTLETELKYGAGAIEVAFDKHIYDQPIGQAFDYTFRAATKRIPKQHREVAQQKSAFLHGAGVAIEAFIRSGLATDIQEHIIEVVTEQSVPIELTSTPAKKRLGLIMAVAEQARWEHPELNLVNLNTKRRYYSDPDASQAAEIGFGYAVGRLDDAFERTVKVIFEPQFDELNAMLTNEL